MHVANVNYLFLIVYISIYISISTGSSVTTECHIQLFLLSYNPVHNETKT